ncbi:ABC transporter substrate-binding protein [Halovulum dunhuangense]|uniref:ABC transporter substrate-binding protein n=1 Tax=Halovulum dunhuangense TaxID=1505036 RepID=A0A849L037_9RHOB|nr:ABC transporter substrate-binding protein [Halovulum dunhuangense]NNU79050.1 ABC transporter substrate-binding protein [Halovulum dunhuangense]
MRNTFCRSLGPIMLAAGLAYAAPAAAGPQDDTLRAALAGEILNLDYLYTTRREYIILAQMTDATLFTMNPETQAIEPGVATSYEFVDDMTIDVQLRDDVRFHDGTPLTAADVAYTYNWVIDENSESHAQALISRWLERAEVTGDHSVRFHLRAINPLIIRDMAQRVMLRKDGAYHQGTEVDRNAMATQLVGAGPYRVASFQPGVEVVLERFDDYYGDAPDIGNIVVRNLPDMGTQQAELMSGGIDWMFNVPLDVARSLDAHPDIEHLAGPDLRVSFIVLDAAGLAQPDGPLTDLRVRQAMNHAVNKPEIAEFLMGGGASEPIYSACHPVQFGCVQDVPRYEYDPERARALLAEAGYPDGFELDLWAYRERPVSEAVMADLEAVGIDINLRYVQLETLNQARANREIPAYIGTWGSSGVADTALIARVHFSDTSDRHLSGDEEVVEWVLAAEQTADQDARFELYKQAITRIAEQAYWVPLVSYSADYLVRTELDFPLDNDGVPRLQNARWK